MRLGLGCLALIACGTSTPVEAPKAAAQNTYAIHLARPSKVGERAHVVIDQTSDTKTKVGGDLQRVDKDSPDQHVVHLDAVLSVIAVDERGRATRELYDVKELTKDGARLKDGQGAAVSRVELTGAKEKKDAVLTVDGAPSTAEVRNVLSSLLKLRLDDTNDDDAFGTTTPQRIGAHWPIHGDAAIASLNAGGLQVSSATGDMWLEGTTRVDGAECLDVRGKLDVSGIKVPGMPEGSVTLDGQARAEMRAELPIDGHVERASSHMAMNMAFHVGVPTPQGPPVLVSVEARETTDSHTTRL
jgi:hypothetical protein